jgi:hypothetical protein
MARPKTSPLQTPTPLLSLVHLLQKQAVDLAARVVDLPPHPPQDNRVCQGQCRRHDRRPDCDLQNASWVMHTACDGSGVVSQERGRRRGVVTRAWVFGGSGARALALPTPSRARSLLAPPTSVSMTGVPPVGTARTLGLGSAVDGTYASVTPGNRASRDPALSVRRSVSEASRPFLTRF